MQSFDQLTPRGQQRRLRQLAQAALDRYDLAGAELRFVNHGENTTFQVDSPERDSLPANSPFVPGRYLLRVHGATYNTLPEIASELIWLHALREDIDLAVPEPVLNRAGQFALQVEVPGVPGARTCSLLRWMRGGIHARHPQPHHLKKVGRLAARLHEHAARWRPPAAFTRRRWDWDGMFGDEGHFGASTAVVWEAIPAEYRPQFEAVAGHMRQVMGELGEGGEVWGLIHTDLHMWNVLFTDGEARAIDFDDCGWGYWIYDLALILDRFRGGELWEPMREALFAGYAEIRPLPAGLLEHLDAFIAARQVSVMLWVLGKSLVDPAFRPYVARSLERTAAAVAPFLATLKA
jgi:Ser/Thr protein kinase RdoA (MazF antagonist)